MIFTTTTAIGLGKGLGLILVWIDEKLRQHYNPRVEQNYRIALGSVSPLFFDKEFIRNLKYDA